MTEPKDILDFPDKTRKPRFESIRKRLQNGLARFGLVLLSVLTDWRTLMLFSAVLAVANIYFATLDVNSDEKGGLVIIYIILEIIALPILSAMVAAPCCFAFFADRKGDFLSWLTLFFYFLVNFGALVWLLSR